MPPAPRKLLPLILAATLSACAVLVPDTYLIKQQRLTDQLHRNFPLKRELADGMFSVTLEVPVLGLDVAHNRITVNGRFSAYTILGGTLQGELGFSSALHFDDARRTVFLREPQLDSLTVEQDERYAAMLRPALNMLLLEYLRDHPLYTFQPNELRYAGTDIDISAIVVVPDGLRLQLRPHRTQP